MNKLILPLLLIMHAGFNGRMWSGIEARNMPAHRGGHKIFKMNRRKELKISARRRARH